MIYKSFETAKNESIISVFKDGRPMFSKYNPQRDAENFCSNLKSGFIVIGGIGSGQHISRAKEIFKDSIIVCVEESRESLEFCTALPEIKKLKESENIYFCTPENLTGLLKMYIPSLHRNFTLSFVASWENYNKETAENIKCRCENAIEEAKRDYSVQANFGKIWQRNILLNSREKSKSFNKKNERNLTAAVIAAGPSTEEKIKKIAQNRDKYYVIATDTGYGILKSFNIHADSVVSVDAQLVSLTHFFNSRKNDSFQNADFYFDLSGNHSAVNYLLKNSRNVIFTKNMHPLSNWLDRSNKYQPVDTGSGTVLIAALDIACKLGFTKIEFFGADFAYINNKPYSRGTYLEKNFNCNSTRLNNCETKYTNLAFRTELKNAPWIKSGKTNEIMEGYKNGLLLWCRKNNFVLQDDMLYFEGEKISMEKKENECGNNLIPDESLLTLKTPLLPYVAWLLKNNPAFTADECLKLAFNHSMRYNQDYES